MKITTSFIRWFRPRPPEVTDAKIVYLTPAPDPADLSSTIVHPETYSPVPQSVSQADIHRVKAALMEYVTAKVAALHERGGLDQDNLSALWVEIETWRDGFIGKLYQEAESARGVASRIRSQLYQNLEAEQGRLSSLNRQHAEALEHHQTVLAKQGFLGRPVTPDPLEELLDGPSAHHLDRHLPPLKSTPTTKQKDPS